MEDVTKSPAYKELRKRVVDAACLVSASMYHTDIDRLTASLYRLQPCSVAWTDRELEAAVYGYRSGLRMDER